MQNGDETPQESILHTSDSRPERRLLVWFFVILAINVASLLWLSVRSESPRYIQSILDFIMHGSSGAVVAYFAFRALVLYPFRFPDLLLMVLVLSLEAKVTIDQIRNLSQIGLISERLDEPAEMGKIFQICLLVGSVAVAGAAFGLRHCHILKIEGSVERLLAIVCGMLALPAAAGTAGFFVPLIISFVHGEVAGAFLFFFLWTASFIVTAVNVAYFIRTSTLKAEIVAQEKLSQK